MDITEILSFVNQNTELFIIANSSIILFLLLITLYTLKRNANLQKKWKVLLKGNNKNNLEKMLQEQVLTIEYISDQLVTLNKNYTHLHKKANGSLQKIGFVRFNAFENIGGDQSFALAMINNDNNGILISSIVGRNDCRVYSKLIENGKTPRNTLPEEELAIKTAIQNTSINNALASLH